MTSFKIRSLKYNFVMNLVLTGSSVIFPFITFPFVSRALLADTYGLCNWASSVISWFSLIAMLGVNQYGIREVARFRDDPKKLSEITVEIFTFTLISTFISYFCFFIALFNIESFSQHQELMLINSITILFNTLGVGWFFQGIEQYRYITIRGIIIKAVCFIGVVLLIHTPDDYLIYALLVVCSSALANLINFIYMFYILNSGLSKASRAEPANTTIGSVIKFLSFSRLKRHIKPMFIFFLIAASISVYNLLNIIMLGFLSNYEEVGYYTAAMNITGAVTGVISALSGVLMPRATNLLAKNDISQYKKLIKKCIYFVLLISIIICSILSIIATPLLTLYAGEAYRPAGPMLSLTCLASIPAALSVIFFNSVLAPLNLEKYSMLAYAFAAAINFICNLYLIPNYGGIGASCSTLLVESLLALYGFFLAKKFIWGNALS